MMNRTEWRWIITVTLALLIASNLPYLAATVATPEGYLFTGLLVNPLDGHSYIAKMRQGLEGSWRFRLAFTPETHPGAYLFLAHIALGHLARWTDLPLIVVYHGARILAGVFLLAVLYAFVAMYEQDLRSSRDWHFQIPPTGTSRDADPLCRLPATVSEVPVTLRVPRNSWYEGAGERRRMTFLMAATSAGWGWLISPLTGHLSPDLWIPEAFVFYSILANFHFPLSIALMLTIVMALARPGREPGLREALLAALASLGLGVMQPFAVIPVYAALSLRLVLRLIPWPRGTQRKTLPWRTVWCTAIAALIALAYPVYGLWAIRSDPVLSNWNAQNLTPSPPLWDWLAGFGLPALLALPGLAVAVRRRSEDDLLPLAWTLAAVIGMYIPLTLQRRLSIGLQIPVALLATRGWWEVIRPHLRPRLRPVAQAAVTGFSALGNLFLVGMLIMAALAGEPLFYIGEAEWRAITWLREEAAPESVVLCAPTTGMLIPAWAGQRVVYGHPFETVDAAQREAQVTAFWSGAMGLAERERFLTENNVRYLFIGPRERALGDPMIPEGARLRFRAGDVAIYELEAR